MLMMRAEIAKKRIRELIKNASKKSEKSAIIVRVLHEAGLHDLPKKETMKIAREHGIPKYNSYINNGLKIARALGKIPSGMKEFRDGVSKAGLGDLSEKTKLDIASNAFGIKEASSSKWKISIGGYAQRIEKALGRKPKTIKEVFEGAELAGLGHLSEGTLLSVAHQGFGMKEAGPREWGLQKINKESNEMYIYFKTGGKFSWDLPYSEESIKRGVLKYINYHLYGKMPNKAIRKILEKRGIPKKMIDEIMEIVKS